MRRMTLALLVAAALTACSGITIGPVDTSCHVNPARSDGSGCGGRHADARSSPADT